MSAVIYGFFIIATLTLAYDHHKGRKASELVMACCFIYWVAHAFKAVL